MPVVNRDFDDDGQEWVDGRRVVKTWQERFDEQFPEFGGMLTGYWCIESGPYDNSGAGKIKSFIAEVTKEEKEELFTNLLEQVASLKVTAPVDSKEYGRLPKAQVFQLGQMNMIFRLRNHLTKYWKERNGK